MTYSLVRKTLEILDNFCKLYWLLGCCQINIAVKERRASFMLAWIKWYCSVSGLWTVLRVPSAHSGRLGKRMGGLSHSSSLGDSGGETPPKAVALVRLGQCHPWELRATPPSLQSYTPTELMIHALLTHLLE